MSKRFRITASDIQGLGLHTMQDLVIGEILFDIKGEGIKKNSRDAYTIEVDGEHYMHGRAQFINHSDTPNLKFHSSGILFANQYIMFGEELTYDYRQSESEFAGDFKV